MEVILLIVAMLAAFHAFTYARWLKQEGNKAGAMGVCFFILVGLILPVYKMMSGS